MSVKKAFRKSHPTLTRYLPFFTSEATFHIRIPSFIGQMKTQDPKVELYLGCRHKKEHRISRAQKSNKTDFWIQTP